MANTAFQDRLPQNPQYKKVTKTFTNFSAAALTNDIEIYSLPANGVLRVVIQDVATTFSGGTIATYTISVGIAGQLALFAIAFDVKTGVVNTQATDNIYINKTGAAVSIRAAAITTVANLDAATQGAINFHLEISQLL